MAITPKPKMILASAALHVEWQGSPSGIDKILLRRQRLDPAVAELCMPAGERARTQTPILLTFNPLENLHVQVIGSRACELPLKISRFRSIDQVYVLTIIAGSASIRAIIQPDVPHFLQTLPVITWKEPEPEPAPSGLVVLNLDIGSLPMPSIAMPLTNAFAPFMRVMAIEFCQEMGIDEVALQPSIEMWIGEGIEKTCQPLQTSGLLFQLLLARYLHEKDAHAATALCIKIIGEKSIYQLMHGVLAKISTQDAKVLEKYAEQFVELVIGCWLAK